MSVLAQRLKEARQRKGLSQERLGVLAGIDEMTASARMNQYEKGKHMPDWLTLERIAKALDVPVPYFYAAESDLAHLLLLTHTMTQEERQQLLQFAQRLTDERVGPGTGG
jgi:transcriptional regulator with XRE-family HTH domain